MNPARLECILLGMQGLGKPGVHQFRTTQGKPRADVPLSTRLPIAQVKVRLDKDDLKSKILFPRGMVLQLGWAEQRPHKSAHALTGYSPVLHETAYSQDPHPGGHS